MKREIIRIIRAALEKLGVAPTAEIEVEIPKVASFGDISSPVAMGLAKTLRKAPRKIAEEIIDAIADRGIFERIEIAGGGFINFTFTQEYLHSALTDLLSGEKTFLREDVGRGKKVLVEYVSANPTGPLHIGHARGAAVGNALCNLLEEMGFVVRREYYINDAGRQVRLLGESVPEDGYKGDYIVDEIVFPCFRDKVNEMDLCKKEFSEVSGALTDLSYKKMLAIIKEDLANFGVSFDSWVSEKQLYEKGEVAGAIEALKEKGLMYEKDGALWFRSADFGDDKDRVVVKSDGEYTYFASDIAYHKDKLDRGFDIIIDIWGADHHGYIPRIESVMKAFGYDSSRFRVILVQMVNLLKDGAPFQMSKRAGNFVTLDDVVSLVDADSTKFIFLTRKADSHLDFDSDLVKSTSAENPVYYVQYANARINSILSNAREKGLDIEGAGRRDLAELSGAEELSLVKKLLAYPMVLEGAAKAWEPHRLTFYLHELAGMFHHYYHTHKVLTDDAETTQARLALCKAIRVVFHDALAILGVSAPERM
jgi:arginyl-tRNA synthetase